MKIKIKRLDESLSAKSFKKSLTGDSGSRIDYDNIQIGSHDNVELKSNKNTESPPMSCWKNFKKHFDYMLIQFDQLGESLESEGWDEL